MRLPCKCSLTAHPERRERPHHCITQASQCDHRFECEVPRSARNDPFGGLLPIFRALVSWLNTDGTKGSREKNPATARGNPEARPALLRKSRADNQRSQIRSAL